MSVHTEIERRWIVTVAPGALEQLKRTHIEQGYLITDALTEEHVRVRIKNGTEAEFAQKFGSGIERNEDEAPADLASAKWLLDRAVYKLEKDRYRIPTTDGLDWMIDVLAPPFEWTMAEVEMTDRNSTVEFPSIITPVMEITDSVTNYHLARAAPELIANPKRNVLDLVAPFRDIKRAVVTGGPGCGKTFFREQLEEEFVGVVHGVPEVAELLIKRVKAIPNGDPEKVLALQSVIARVQRQFEIASYHQIRNMGIRLIVTDRGTVDGLAYTPGGRPVFEKHVLGRSVQEEYKQYAVVVYFEMPPQNVWEEIRRKSGMGNDGKAGRYEESYEDAVQTALKTRLAWEPHPNFHYVRHIGGMEGFARKDAEAREIIRPYMLAA